MRTALKSFASDNNAPVHKAVFRAMMEANQGDAIGYGDDIHTLEAEQKIKELFGKDVRVYFMLTGTGANVAALSHITRPYHAIICSDKAHLENDECGAPEKMTGCKLHQVPSVDGKIRVEQLQPFLKSKGFQHHSQPKVISITQATEMGTVYHPEEVRAIARFAHEHDLYVHMDGARIANAAASLDASLVEMTRFSGIDVLSFGATKNGAMAAEAVVFFNRELAVDFEYTRKQSMQLMSKMRYVSSQFYAMHSGNLWLENAKHANAMAHMLAEKIKDIPSVKITQKVETNAVFAIIPPEAIEKLQRRYFFYTWDAAKSEVRWMTSYDTTEKDIEQFVTAIREAVEQP